MSDYTSAPTGAGWVGVFACTRRHLRVLWVGGGWSRRVVEKHPEQFPKKTWIFHFSRPGGVPDLDFLLVFFKYFSWNRHPAPPHRSWFAFSLRAKRAATGQQKKKNRALRARSARRSLLLQTLKNRPRRGREYA